MRHSVGKSARNRDREAGRRRRRGRARWGNEARAPCPPAVPQNNSSLMEAGTPRLWSCFCQFHSCSLQVCCGPAECSMLFAEPWRHRAKRKNKCAHYGAADVCGYGSFGAVEFNKPYELFINCMLYVVVAFFFLNNFNIHNISCSCLLLFVAIRGGIEI